MKSVKVIIQDEILSLFFLEVKKDPVLCEYICKACYCRNSCLLCFGYLRWILVFSNRRDRDWSNGVDFEQGEKEERGGCDGSIVEQRKF